MQGLVIYAFSSALPLLVFAFLGPIIRKKTPDGFVLTEWTRQRYGVVTAIYLSLLTWVYLFLQLTSFVQYNDGRYSLITMFLFMVAELSALQQIINALTGLNGLPVVIVQCVVTTIYTCLSPIFNF